MRKTSQRERRQFSREFKLEALGRLEDAGNVQTLAEELGIRRELLYKWQKQFEASGPEGLRNSGRPRPVLSARERLEPDARIAELERKLGKQAMELDFFRGALRRIEALRRLSDGPGATVSSRRSKR